MLKSLASEDHKRSLEQERRAFLRCVRERRFLRAALVRARGQITGFLTDEIGLIETSDLPVDDGGRRPEEAVTMVVFHVSDLYLFRLPWSEQRRRRRRPMAARAATTAEADVSLPQVQDAFPPGLRVCFDARAVTRYRGVTAQAVAVFAGSWPATPHPTALPGGPGSLAPCHESISIAGDRQTFYYLNASLAAEMEAKMRSFVARADASIELLPSEFTINSAKDYQVQSCY